MKSYRTKLMENLINAGFITELADRSELFDYARIVNEYGTTWFDSPGNQAMNAAIDIIETEILARDSLIPETMLHDLTRTAEEIAEHRGIQLARANQRKNRADTVLYMAAARVFDKLRNQI